MESINKQIESCVSCFEANTIKRMVIPYFWFSYQFTRISGITFEGHDQSTIDCYNNNNELIHRVVICEL
jgi:hypothetical protein